MTGTEMERDEIGLEAFFAAARRAAPAPSEALMARVLADAEETLPRPAADTAADRTAPSARPGPRVTGLRGLLGTFGGWGGLGGLATAALAGLWFGYAGPGDPASVAAMLTGGEAQETTELLPEGETIALLAGWEG